MVDAAHYSARELMRDGSPIEIRSLKQADQEQLLAAVGHISKESFYRRFFGPKREFTEKEMAKFLKDNAPPRAKWTKGPDNDKERRFERSDHRAEAAYGRVDGRPTLSVKLRR